MTPITRDEWLKALSQAETSDPDALTAAEIRALTGVSKSATTTQIAALVKAGKARRTWKQITQVDGYRRRVPAYVLLIKPKKGKAA